jgi:alginate O-acetyltransferase complex protein AlgI
LEPTNDLLTFAVYVSYFPQLVAGPIERARRLLPQLQSERHRITPQEVHQGVSLIVLGLFKKVAIADPIGHMVVDPAFAAGSDTNTATLVLGAFGFGLQVYGDFSGYSDIARGSSRLLGIELMRNFEQPFLSRNIMEFWRRWHVSLSTWLFDYLYIPLGGNQRGRLAMYRNLMLVMLLGGLWHGAAWTFVSFGAVHGLYLAMHRRFGAYVPRESAAPIGLKDAPRVIATFIAISLAWPLFRAPSIRDSLDYFSGMVALTAGSPSLDQVIVFASAALAVLVIDLAQRKRDEDVMVLHWRPWMRGVAYSVVALSLLMWIGDEAQPFIYFQF